MKRGGTRGEVISIRIAPEGRRNSTYPPRSIEHVFLVELDAVGAQNAQELGSEVFGFMMLGRRTVQSCPLQANAKNASKPRWPIGAWLPANAGEVANGQAHYTTVK